MPRSSTSTDPHQRRFAGLDFIKAAFCPLDFKAIRLGDHPNYAQVRFDKALAELEVADTLQYPRKFSFTDRQGHRKTGIQMITAHFGLAPTDFDMFLGLFTYLKRLPEPPADSRLQMTLDFLARQVGLPARSAADYQRLRSRLFRFSYVKYTNSALWNAEAKTYDIANLSFFNLDSLSRITESRRPVVLGLDSTFLRLVNRAASLSFDFALYRSLSPAMRRFYLIANRDGWNQAASSLFLADEFAIHQIGYGDAPELSRLRQQKIKHLLVEAEDLGLIRPFAPWRGYFQKVETGLHRNKLALRWMRGPRLRKKEGAVTPFAKDDLASDALYAQIQELKDEEGQSLVPGAYQKLLAQHGAKKLSRHIAIILAQREHHPGSFTRSEVAAFIDRVTKDHPEPDWYQVLRRAERLEKFDDIQPNQLSLDLYGDLFH